MHWPSEPIHALAGTIAVVAIFALLHRRSVTRRIHPPGPPGQFLVGNLGDIPSSGYEWEAYRALGEHYGKFER